MTENLVPSHLRPRPVEWVAKPWGHEEILAVVDGLYAAKTLHVRAGQALSLQWHHDKDETLTVLSGSVEMDLGTSPDALYCVAMSPGESMHVTPRLLHRVRGVTDAVIVEASTADPGWREDIVRLEDRYGRAGTRAP